MIWLHGVAWFFGGAFLANAVPHLVSGLRGEAFQSPFAKPPGQGRSSATVNVLWGAFNLVIAYLLIYRVGRFALSDTLDAGVFGLGILVIGLFSARHFGRFNGGRAVERP